MPLVVAVTELTTACRNPSNTTAQDAVKAFGRILADRYNPIVGCTRSWDTADPTDFQVRLGSLFYA